MGKNFLDIPEAARSLTGRMHNIGKLFSYSHCFAHVPFSEGKLEATKETHLLVAVLPLSMNLICSYMPELFRSLNSGLWWRNRPCADICGKPAWWLVRKTPEPGSFGKLLVEQRQLLADDDLIPPARVMVYASVINFLTRGERMFEKTYVRCVGRDADNRLSVGFFNRDGIAIVGHIRDGFSPVLGLASAKKPQLPQ
jgi:hypothetical protein